MEITLDLIKDLRNKTGAGINDCKKALIETDGDIQKAIELLRKKGAATAMKRADKVANEGAIKTKISADKKTAAIVEINCETDFVAKGDNFQKFAEETAKAALNAKSDNVDTILGSKTGEGITVKEALDSIVSAVAEKTELRRAKIVESADGFVADYVHFGSKLGSLVVVKGKLTDASEALAKNLAMQVVAMNPLAIDRSGIGADVIEKEKDIYMTLAKNEGKAENIAERIVLNKVEKFYQDNTLLEQESIKESGRAVQDLIKDYKKSSGEEFDVIEMVRYQLGG